MKVNIIDSTRYEILEGGIQVGQGGITEEWAEAARVSIGADLTRAQKQRLAKVVGKALAADVEPDAEPVDVTPEVAATYPRHSHAEYLETLPPHDHDLPAHGDHHEHPEPLATLAQAQSILDGYKKEIASLSDSLASQRLDDRAEIFRAIDNLNRSLSDSMNTLRNVVNSVEARIPTSVPDHSHAVLNEAITNNGQILQRLIEASQQSQTQHGIDLRELAASLRAEMANIQPKGDYITKDQLDRRKGEFKLLSTQEVGGKQRWILEEV